jgi:tRNA/tmRNA/rRNA uracil-C5-methylase (TrmA/RlmC/RlmD family)
MSPEQKRVRSKIGKIVFNSFEEMADKIGLTTERNSKYSQYILQHTDNNSVVLDLGCNAGTFTSDLSKKVAQVISIDFDREILHYVARMHGVYRIL